MVTNGSCRHARPLACAPTLPTHAHTCISSYTLTHIHIHISVAFALSKCYLIIRHLPLCLCHLRSVSWSWPVVRSVSVYGWRCLAVLDGRFLPVPFWLWRTQGLGNFRRQPLLIYSSCLHQLSFSALPLPVRVNPSSARARNKTAFTLALPRDFTLTLTWLWLRYALSAYKRVLLFAVVCVALTLAFAIRSCRFAAAR